MGVLFIVFPDTSTPKLSHVSLASFADNTMPASSISSIAFAKDTAQRLRSCSAGFSFDVSWLSMGQELWCYIYPFNWFGVRIYKKYIEHQVSELDTNSGIFFPIHQIIILMCWALNLDPSSQKSSVPKELQFEGVRSLRGR